MGFLKWIGVHNSPDQIKRLASAKKADCTPISISKEEESGVFSGSHGTYSTTLESCTCVDFSRRRLPCKHMYRLAMELGVYEGDFVSDSSKIKKKVDKREALIAAVHILETEPDFLPIVHKIMYCFNTKQSYVCYDVSTLSFLLDNNLIVIKKDYQRLLEVFGQKKTIDALEEKGFAFDPNLKYRKDKYQWCLQNADEVGPLIFENAGIIEPFGLLLDSPKKIYSYISSRTDDSDISVDLSTGEITADFLDSDKDVAELLIQYYGLYRDENNNSPSQTASDD